MFIRYHAPPPKAAVLEKSIDGGQTYVPMQYFADDCQQYFGVDNDAPLSCPGSSDLSSPELRELVLADHVQLRLVDFFTTNTTEQHRYYSISEIIVAGR